MGRDWRRPEARADRVAYVEGSGLPKGKRRKGLLFVFHGMMGGHVLQCHVDFSMHVPDVGVIIGRWPVFPQVRVMLS